VLCPGHQELHSVVVGGLKCGVLAPVQHAAARCIAWTGALLRPRSASCQHPRAQRASALGIRPWAGAAHQQAALAVQPVYGALELDVGVDAGTAHEQPGTAGQPMPGVQVDGGAQGSGAGTGAAQDLEATALGVLAAIGMQGGGSDDSGGNDNQDKGSLAVVVRKQMAQQMPKGNT